MPKYASSLHDETCERFNLEDLRKSIRDADEALEKARELLHRIEDLQRTISTGGKAREPAGSVSDNNGALEPRKKGAHQFWVVY